MEFQQYRYLILSDLYRLYGRANFSTLAKAVLIGSETYQYNFWMRTCAYTRVPKLLRYSVYPIGRFFLRRMSFRYGISIPHGTQIASGFYIGHFGTIVVSGTAVIGKNCNISHGVTLGRTNRGQHVGAPVIGDNVYIGPGAKVIGAVTIGRNAAIGANCVVTDDVPENAVVVGIPGKVISDAGADTYINHTNYDKVI